MPATSRSGERLSRRSGSGRAGSPSKSRITQPRSVSIVWPRCRSPCVRITRPPVPVAESDWSRSRTSWPRPAISAVGPSSGSSRKTRSICSSMSATSSAIDSALGSSGANAGVLGLRAQRGVQLAGHAAEAAACARAARPARSRCPRARGPSPRARRPGTAWSTPSVASMRRPWTSYQPASGAMCSKPRAERKRSSSSSGFTPGSTRRKAFRISASPKTTDELDCSTPTGPDLDAARRALRRGRRPAEADGAVLDRDVVALAHAVQQLAPLGGVGEPVVDRPAVGLEDHALRSSPRPPAGARAAAGRSRASPRRSGPRRSRARAAAARRGARRPRRSRSARPRATWSRTSAGR